MGQKRGTALKKAERFETAGDGLRLVCIGRALYFSLSLLYLFPFYSNIPRIVPLVLSGIFAVMEIYGLYVARVSHPGFHRAFWAELIGIIVTIVAIPLSGRWQSVTLLLLGSLVNLCIVWPLADAAKDLLTQKGDHTWAKGADWLRWGYVLILVIHIGLVGLAFASALLQTTQPATGFDIVRRVFGTVLNLYFILFCFQSSRSLRR